jgi:uncharacterized phage protein (TIGR02216 family)
LSASQIFPWEDAMMLGLSILRWSPDRFWCATPRELFAAWEGLSGGGRMEPALSRDIRRMMEAFPDEAEPAVKDNKEQIASSGTR